MFEELLISGEQLPTKNPKIFKSLEKFLNIPLYSWSRWNQDTVKKEMNYLPIPYLLTPNKNVEIDSKGEQLKSLLEIDIIHRGLVNILGDLP